MRNFNFLSKSSSQSGSHGVVTLASAVGSPSAHRRKNILKHTIFILLFLIVGVGNVWGATVTYTITSTSTVSTSGTAPEGSSASYSQTYGTSQQATSGNTMTLTLNGFDGCTITGVSVSVHNNSSKGAGSGSLTINGTNKGSVTGLTGLGNTSWTSKSFTVTSTTVNTSASVVVQLSCSANSLYCQSFTITYTAPSASVAVTSVSVSPTSKSIVPGETFDITPTVLPNNASNKNINWSTSNSSKATVSNGTVTGVAAGTATITATSAADNTKKATCSVTVRAVTLQARDEDGNAIAAGGPGAPSRTGKNITPAADANNYVFKEWSISGASLGSSKTTKINTITNPTGAVTVTAVYYKPIPVTWNTNGSLHETTYTGYNQKPVFPDEPSSCDATSNTFYGWTTSTWDNTIDNLAGKTVYTAANDMPNVTATGVVYNAVFAKASEGSVTWTKATSISAGDVVVFTYGTTNKAAEMTGVSGSGTSTSRTKIPDNIEGTYLLTVETGNGGSGYSFKNGNNYLSWSSGNSLETSTTKNNASSWTVNVSSGDFKLTNVGTTDRKLQYNASSPRWACYTTSQTAFQIYKRSVNYTYSKYLTTCCTPLGTLSGVLSLGQLATPAEGKLKASWRLAGTTGIGSLKLQLWEKGDTDTQVGEDINITPINTTAQNYTFEDLDYCATYYAKLIAAKDAGTYCTTGWTETSGEASTLGYAVELTDNGSVTGGTFSTNKARACAGDEVTLTATPASGYLLGGWTVLDGNSDEISAKSTTTNTFVFDMPASGVIAEATFCTQPTAPTGLSYTLNADATRGKTILSWNSVTGATGYVLNYTKDAVAQTPIDVNATSYTFNPLAVGTYTWSVKAKNACGESDAANGEGFIICPDISGASVTIADVTPVYVPASNTWSATISWTAVANATAYQYKLIRTTDSETIISETTTTGTSIEATGLTNESAKNYKFSIKAKNACEELMTNYSEKTFGIAPVHTLSYNANGGSSTPSSEYKAKYASVTAAAAIEKTGYDFTGWKRSDNDDIVAAGASFSMPDANLTLTAQWQIKSFSVTFNKNHEDATGTMANQVHDYSTTPVALTANAFAREGYQFMGWATSSDGDVVYANGANYTFTASATLYAVWSKLYTVEWYVKGSKVSDQIAIAGTTMNYPSNPDDDELEDCGTNAFMGWSESELKGNGHSAPEDIFTSTTGATTITADKKYYAVFAKVVGASGYEYIGDEGMLETGKTYIFVSSKTAGSAYALKSSDLPANATGSKGTAVSVTIATGIKIATTNTDLEFYCQTHTEDEEDILKLGSTDNTVRINGNGIGYGTARAYYDNTGLYGWSNGSSPSYYDVYYNSTSGKFEASSSAGGKRVYAYKKLSSTTSDYQTGCCETLGAVSNVNVVPSRTSATVSWDKLTNASGYEYKLGDADWATASVADANNPSISLSALTGATSYAIQIRATGDGSTYCDKGTASAVTNFKTLSRVTAAVNDGERGAAKVSLNGEDWAASVDAADGTTIYLQATPSSASWILGSWGASNGDVASNQLTGWTGDVTVTANFAAAELPTLATPTGMSSSAVTAISATISWNAVANASSYAISCTPSATQGDVTESAGVCSCTLTGLSAGTAYTWNVQAIGDNISYKSGAACADQNFTTVAKQPTAVAVTTAPSKTSYLEGESFDATGMVVRVTYNTEEVDDDADNYTVTPAGALEYGTTSVTITVNGSAISTTQAITVVKKYTLTLKNNGVQVGEVRNLYEGAEYGALPTLTAGDACDATSTTFLGWTTESILAKQSAAPASYASATSVMGTGNVVLNAVWAKTKTPGVEPVSITSFAAGTYYLIDIQGEHYYAMSGTGTSKVDGVDVTDYVSYNSTTKQITITDESHMTAAMKYTISGTTSAAKIYNANKSKWVSTQSSGTSFSDSEGSNVVTKHSEDPRFAFSYATMGTSGNRCILYRSSQSGFCNYATGNMNQSTYGTGYLWLVTVGSPAVYEDYLTSCCTDWSESAPAISYSTPDHWKAGDDDVAVTIASGTTYGAVSFESSDEDVLTVDAETGAIHAVAMGTATVTATWAGGVVDAVRYCSASSSVEVAVSGTVTVSFDGNGATNGTMTDQVIYYNEATALKANAFSKDGFDFYGWAETDEKADAGNRDYEGGETVTFTTDKTLYAVWQTKVHDLTLTQPTVSEVAAGTITANGSTTSPASIAYGVEVTLSASENSTAMDGYVFENWSVSGITLADATANPAVFTMPDNDVAVAAVYHHYTWNLTGYTVTTAPETLYSNGDQFDKSSVVIKAGYERSDNSSTKQVTLDAAEWTAKLDGSVIANNYTFALADNGKTLTLWVDETKVGEDYVLTVNAIPTDHFVINIWTSEISPIADKTSAYSMPSLSDQTAGAAATCKDHNLFVGWVEELYKDEPEGHIVAANTAMTPSNKTYYAVWGKTGTITESISYGWEAGDIASNWSMSGTGLTATTGSARTGTYGASMTTTGTYVKTLSRYATPKGITYYIRKQSGNDNTNNYYVLRYSSDNSNWTEIESTKYTFKQLSNTTWTEVTCDLRAETYQNKYFEIRMISSANGSLDDIEFSYTTSGAVDYITDCVQRYQVTFNANGGTGSYDAIEKKEGATVTLPDGSALSRAAEHYHFNGWKVYNASTEEEISVSENQFTMPGAAVNAVAQWEEDPKGTVRYVGDEILNSSITRYAGQTYDLRTEVTLPAGRKLVGWMLEGDETLYAPGRTMTMPDPVQNITYNVQVIDQLPTPSGVSFSDGEWVLVTNTNQLSAGDFVVIVANGLTNAMGTQANTNRGIASVTKHNEGQTITLTENVAKLFLQYGYREGEFALYDMAENGYLYASSNTSNDLKTSATYSNRNYSWLITIGEGNIASIVAKGANSHNNLKYNPNSGSPLFSCYTGGQTAVQLYRYDGHKTVEITENVNASAIYLDDADVVVKNGATLTIDEPATLDNVIVEVGGKVTNTNNLTVNDLTIKSEAGKSGQVTNGNKISVNGALYMDVTFFKGATALTAETADRWYMISAPFDVNLSNGFCQVNGTPMVFGQDFDLFEYEGSKRAETGVTGWKRAQGKMNAGVACLIGFNAGQPTTIRLKAASTDLEEKTSISLQAFTGDDDNKNWNGVANPTLHYTDISHDVQTYNNEDGENGRKYIAYTASSTSFVVGTAFFLQETGTMTLSAATHDELRAPKRAEADERYEACVRIFRQEATEFGDQMYVRASETALSQYEQGHDMITWNGTTGNTAMIWAENYGKRLAIEEAPLVNDKASYELGIFAPQAGTYRIAMTSEDDAELYLTYNGRAIWNLSMSECELELAQGQNAGYGLRLVVKVPSVVTGIENSEVSDQKSDVQKVIIDEHVFILRGGQMYDVNGKMVK